MAGYSSHEIVEDQLPVRVVADEDATSQRITYVYKQEGDEPPVSLISIRIDTVTEKGKESHAPHVSIQVDRGSSSKDTTDPRWASSPAPAIRRVPDCFPKVDGNPYAPMIVSIGPLHQNKKSLQPMEAHKRRYQQEVISKAKEYTGLDEERISKKFRKKVKSLEKTARDCYLEEFDLESDAFVEMMVVDGCFIIGLLCKFEGGVIETDPNDPVFRMGWLMTKLQNDLLLFENQIPFDVLQQLYDVTKFRTSLVTLALDFFQRLLPQNRNSRESKQNAQPQHLLDLFRSSTIPDASSAEDKQSATSDNPFKLIKPVTALKEAGIKFKNVEGGANSFFDVRFDRGTIEIPTITIYGNTKSLFLNLIAFEQCDPDGIAYFTDYTAFMNVLINSDKDAETLCHSRIIENWLGTDNEVVDFFDILGRDLPVDPSSFYLSRLLEDVNRYYDTPWRRLLATLKHDYFKDPWSIIAFIVALSLLVLTIWQSVFAGLSYFRPP